MSLVLQPHRSTGCTILRTAARTLKKRGTFTRTSSAAAVSHHSKRRRAVDRRVLPVHAHLFRMTDGSCIAFFDLGDDVAAEKSPNTPEWVNHIALRVDSVEELARLKARLEAHGVEVLGVTDHHIFQSIYFFDPNGIRSN